MVEVRAVGADQAERAVLPLERSGEHRIDAFNQGLGAVLETRVGADIGHGDHPARQHFAHQRFCATTRSPFLT